MNNSKRNQPKLFISHRGNLYGKEEGNENNPSYVLDALAKGFDVEIDLWDYQGKFYLGHDEPQYELSHVSDFLLKNNLWIHCKNYEALKELTILKRRYKMFANLNFFYHTNEDYVLTSRGYIWAYPGKLGDANTICVLPESQGKSTNLHGFLGFCSDYIFDYKEYFKTN